MQGTPTVWSLIFRKCFTLRQDFSIIVVQYLIGSFTFWCMACTAEDVLRLFHNRRYCICIVSIYHARNSTYMLMWRQHVCTLTKTSWDYLIKDSLCCLLSKESLKWQKERKLMWCCHSWTQGLWLNHQHSELISNHSEWCKVEGKGVAVGGCCSSVTECNPTNWATESLGLASSGTTYLSFLPIAASKIFRQ